MRLCQEFVSFKVCLVYTEEELQIRSQRKYNYQTDFSNFWFCLLPQAAKGCDLLYWSVQSQKPESWTLPWILFNLERIWKGLLWTWVSTTKTSLCLLAADGVGCSFNLQCVEPTDQSSDHAPFSRDCQQNHDIVYTSFLVSFYLIWEDGKFANKIQ